MKTYRVDALVGSDKLSVGVRDASGAIEALGAAAPLLQATARTLFGIDHPPVRVTAATELRDKEKELKCKP